MVEPFSRDHILRRERGQGKKKLFSWPQAKLATLPVGAECSKRDDHLNILHAYIIHVYLVYVVVDSHTIQRIVFTIDELQ